jgi:hypothetical protein
MYTRAPAFAFATACALVFGGCGGSEAGVEASGTGVSDLSGAPSADAGYFSCAADCDCVAVRLLSDCCDNGWKIAVAKDEAAAYLAATACTARFCPEYVVVDTRVPTCDMAAHRCVMVEPSQATSTQ